MGGEGQGSRWRQRPLESRLRGKLGKAGSMISASEMRFTEGGVPQDRGKGATVFGLFVGVVPCNCQA